VPELGTAHHFSPSHHDFTAGRLRKAGAGVERRGPDPGGQRSWNAESVKRVCQHMMDLEVCRTKRAEPVARRRHGVGELLRVPDGSTPGGPPHRIHALGLDALSVVPPDGGFVAPEGETEGGPLI
jgi:hypothetical protein